MKKYIVRLNGREYEVEIEEVTREENDRYVAPVSSSPAKAAAPQVQPSGVGEGAVVKAPMPGSINDVRVKPGDKVAKGDVLLILEAMKMMNEIVSPQAGTITGLAVAKGDSVSTGDEMVSVG